MRTAQLTPWPGASQDGAPRGLTLQRWATPRPGHALALRPVDISAVSAEAPASRTVTVVAPSGLRIEGVTIADAITLVRGLA